MDISIPYTIGLVIPLYFVLYAMIRMIKHHKDGSDRSRSSKYLYLKYALTILQALVYLSKMGYIAYLCIKSPETSNILLIRAISLALYALGWIFSLILLIFERLKCLEMSWYGHRAFWLCSFVSNCLFMILDLKNYTSVIKDDIRLYTFVSTLLMSGILALFAIFRPDEFFLIQDTMIPLQNATERSDDYTENIQVSINDFKTKIINNRQVVLFNVKIKVKQSTYVISRSYQEFNELHRSLCNMFPTEDYPYLSIPELPVFPRNTCINIKMRDLEEFLSHIVSNYGYMSENVIEFMRIPHMYREEILNIHEEIIEKNKCISQSSYTAMAQESYSGPPRTFVRLDDYFSAGLQSFVVVSIPSWQKSNVEYAAIRYKINWKLVNSEFCGSTKKRYSEINALHKTLKKKTKGLPSFPTKNYLRNFGTVNIDAIEKRKEELEKYLANILNDPAFHCPELFLFISCRMNIEEIWSYQQEGIQYSLDDHAHWETETEGNTFVQKFIFSLAAYYREGKMAQWTFSRSFSEFDQLNNLLRKRNESKCLAYYLKFKENSHSNLNSLPPIPKLPKKGSIPINRCDKIEDRMNKLEKYLEECFQLFNIKTCYAFRSFIKDPL